MDNFGRTSVREMDTACVVAPEPAVRWAFIVSPLLGRTRVEATLAPTRIRARKEESRHERKIPGHRKNTSGVGTRRALEHARDGAERAGVPFVVAAARKSFFELIEHRARTYPHAPAFPQPGNRQCISDLKRDPLTREARRIARARGATLLVTCLGLRADESAKRRARAPLVRSARNSKGGRSWYEWLPMHHLTTPQVFATIREAGEVPHPAYVWGNARLSCMFCIIGCAADARHAAIRNPDLYARYIELETRTGHTLHPSRKTLVEVTGLTVEAAREAHAQIARREARRLPVLVA